MNKIVNHQFPLVERKFLMKMVTGKFISFPNLKSDSQSNRIASEIETAVRNTDYDLGGFITRYSDFIVYTDELIFDWGKDVPEDYRSFEAWWNMVTEGKNAVETYQFYVDNVNRYVTSGWFNLMNDVHKIYVPQVEKDNSKEENADPN